MARCSIGVAGCSIGVARCSIGVARSFSNTLNPNTVTWARQSEALNCVTVVQITTVIDKFGDTHVGPGGLFCKMCNCHLNPSINAQGGSMYGTTLWIHMLILETVPHFLTQTCRAYESVVCFDHGGLNV